MIRFVGGFVPQNNFVDFLSITDTKTNAVIRNNVFYHQKLSVIPNVETKPACGSIHFVTEELFSLQDIILFIIVTHLSLTYLRDTNLPSIFLHNDDLEQDCSISSAWALETLQSCNKPSITFVQSPLMQNLIVKNFITLRFKNK